MWTSGQDGILKLFILFFHPWRGFMPLISMMRPSEINKEEMEQTLSDHGPSIL